MPGFAPEYIAARRVLLDALEALQPHLASLVLVGAQAVYHHAGEMNLAVAVMTADADLALDTAHLADQPEIAATLIDAGFLPGANPGHWLGAQEVGVDIMVVPHQAGTGAKHARSARIPPHPKTVGRIAHGLEPALIDNALATISALGTGDPRAFDLRVAGPAALVVAKTIKIAERASDARRRPYRLRQKDALDMFRLLQATGTERLARGFRSHRGHPQAATASREAVAFIEANAHNTESLLPVLAREAALGDCAVATAFVALATHLISTLHRDGS
ncbi:MAG: hypothetical protein LBK72_10070 [Bifidobacteriaceae bacterium]|jgi:hypothetical protein|nr:hypothetical protein [Bifidobacteriaceae bacterium]